MYISTIIINTIMYYVYSYRVDMKWEDSSKLLSYIEQQEEKPVYYLFGFENKKTTKEEHLQGVMLFREKVQNTQKYRNVKTKKFILKTAQPVSFVIARNAKSIAKYCNDKEKKGKVTNMTTEILESIGKWEDINNKKKDLKKTLYDTYVSKKNGIDSDGAPFEYLVKIHTIDDEINLKGYLADTALEIYLKEGVRPPPMKTLLWIALQAELISRIVFIKVYYRLT